MSRVSEIRFESVRGVNKVDMNRHALIALLVCFAEAAAAQQSLEVISLRYRTADQVLETLRPLLEPGGTLTGQGSQLILRVSPENLAEIRRALDAIDRPQQRLQISVRFDDALEASRRELGASGEIGNRGSRLELRGRDSRTAASERIDQRVQAMDGGRATIFTGDSISGFDVMPRVYGDIVLMEIYAARGTRQVASTASGRLGQWFELGAVDRGREREQSGIGSLSRSERSETRRVWVKVETLGR
jgi:hypothetical protein